MATDPETGRILAVDYMHEPESNAIKVKSLKKNLPIYTECKIVIHDICYKLAPYCIKKNIPLDGNLGNW